MGQYATHRGQPAGRPTVFLHLGIQIYAVLGLHGAEAFRIVRMHGGKHAPGFCIDILAQQTGYDGESGDGGAALAFAKETQSTFAPFRAKVF